MATSIFNVAKTLGNLSDFGLSNLELQKIGYIAEMLHLGRHAAPLIHEDWEAWDYGPVCPELYQWAKMYGSEPVENIFPRMRSVASETTEYECVSDAYKLMRKFTAGKMINITHQHDGAWAKHYRAGKRRVVIPKRDIAREYAVRITED